MGATERDSHANHGINQQVSNMSINGTTNYMSNATILGWMEMKTEGDYGDLRDAMDSTDTRTGAEKALNEIKAKLAGIKTDNATPEDVRKLINQALADFKDLPDVTKLLEPYAKDLNAQADAAAASFNPDPQLAATIANIREKYDAATDSREKGAYGLQLAALVRQQGTAVPLTIEKDKIEGWSESIKGVIDGLSKDDQLGMVNINEFNSLINQARQTASALMDSVHKTADAIISHIS